MWLRTLALMAMALSLSACYPDLDWRTLNAAPGHFTILMPSRPQEDTRAIAEGVSMHQWTAKGGDALFGAGYVDYPDNAFGHIDMLRNALAGRQGSRLAEDRDFSQGGLTGRALYIEFPLPANADKSTKPLTLQVRLLANGKRLYQLAVLSRGGSVSKDDSELFFGSFKLAG